VSEAPRTRPLRILVVNWLDRDNPKAGGAERHLHEIFGRLAACGHEVSVLASGWRGCQARATTNGLRIHRTGRRYTFSLAAPRYYRRHLAGKGFDVVVEDLNKVPVFARYWSRAPVVLLVHHLFGTTAFQAAPVPVALVTWLLERPIPWVYRRAPVIAVSESTRQDLIARGLSRERIQVIPNGIELDRYTPAPGDRRAERPTILFVGRLKRYKRVDVVLQALTRVVESGLDVQLIVVGDGDERAALEAQAGRLGITDRVEFVGYVSEDEKLAHLRRAWLHVLVSSKEGWGISIVEAAACGTPTVASDSPGLRESVVDGETGLLVPHGDVPALAEAMRMLLADSERRRKMGRAARRYAERFSWDASASAVEAVLRRVVAETALD
jgi:glycosyltransferase involved in cell wall biosynthesis